MKRDDVGRALRDLPRTFASEGFRQGVLRRLDERPARRPTYVRFAIAGAAALVLVLVVSIRGREARQDRLASQRIEALREQRLEVLRDEFRALQRDLLALQSLTAQSRPVVGVKGQGDIDFFIDLRNLYVAPASGPRVRGLRPEPVRPASYRP